MSNELQQDFFDYGLLPINDVMELGQIKERVKLRLKRTAEDIIEIGKDLIIAKEKCGHGNFERWLSAEFGMSNDSAQRFMNVSKTFGTEIPHSAVFDFSAKALYLLSAPSTPEPVREQVLQDAENGIVRTNVEIETLKKQYQAAENKLQKKEVELKQQIELTDSIKEQRDRMLSDKDNQLKMERETRQSLIDAKMAEGKMQAKLENQKKLQRVRSEANALQKQLDSLKKQQDSQVTARVSGELAKLDLDIQAKENAILNRQAEVDRLLETKKALDKEVGCLQIHNNYLEQVRLSVKESKVAIDFVQESTDFIPEQSFKDWVLIANVLQKLSENILDWTEKQGSIIEYNT